MLPLVVGLSVLLIAPASPRSFIPDLQVRDQAAIQSAAPLPPLAITARQRQIIADAAAAYPRAIVTLLMHRPTPAYRTFVRSLAAALQQGGMRVTTATVDRYPAGCPQAPGMRVVYGAGRSGTVNAIAEVLIRSGVVADSIPGCPAGQEQELMFIVSGEITGSGR